ncbi:amidohydrolase family protein [Paraglaciecola sp.]|uniref:amidohydrolase family protein n=1 Tax=Paraglaciecola sp. TaxID=1920173 RepID=UPI003EF20CD5
MMLRVDSHQHFWKFTEEDYGWIDVEEKVIRKDFLPSQLSTVLTNNNIDACVAVQARQSLEETNWLLELAANNTFIKGVVGWIDIKADDLELQLAAFNGNSTLKGFRHVLQGEPDPNFMLEDKFISGLHTLQKFGYCYDLLIFAHQLPQAIELAKKVPSLSIVVDHIAKPKIADGSDFMQWKNAIQEIAQFENIYCKVSGMVTEADVGNWKNSDFTPYLDTIFSTFSASRVMFGSDWPVCLLGGSYTDIKQIVEDYVKANYAEAYDQVFGVNAVKFYQL